MNAELMVKRLEELIRSLESIHARAENLICFSSPHVHPNAAESVPPAVVAGAPQLPEIRPLTLRDCHAMTIRLPKEQWELLRAVAGKRARRDGGRISMSQIVAEAVEAYRPILETILAQDSE